MSGLKISHERLNSTLHETCIWGADFPTGALATETGMNRQSLTDLDKEVRLWFVAEGKKLGCEVKVDDMGNIFVIRKGKKEGPPTAMGSHLDTQPRGGRYDGILGVLSALEVLRTLEDNKVETEYPIAAINWTNEEGARFPVMMSCSAAYAHQLTKEEVWDLRDINDSGTSLKSELKRIGFMGETDCSFEKNPIGAHFELHIEQGPRLEQEKKKVAVVLGGQGIRWYTLTITGRSSHAGSTPFSMRADALLFASSLIQKFTSIAASHEGLATIGILKTFPGSFNSICGKVEFSLDMRCLDDEKMEEMENAMRGFVDSEKGKAGCEVEWKGSKLNKTVVFDKVAVEHVRQAARKNVENKQDVMEFFSGPGHDSCMTACVAPTAMIFVPSKGGLSHTPEEYTSPEECTLGAQVLLDAVLSYDKSRKE